MSWTSIRGIVDRYGVGFFSYVAIAGLSALVEWGAFAACLAFAMPILVAALVGFVLATAINFVLSRRLAFVSKRDPSQDMVLVFVFSALAFLANLGAFYGALALFPIGLLSAKIVGTVVGFVFNYLARQFFVFSRDPRFAPVTALLSRRKPHACR